MTAQDPGLMEGICQHTACLPLVTCAALPGPGRWGGLGWLRSGLGSASLPVSWLSLPGCRMAWCRPGEKALLPGALDSLGRGAWSRFRGFVQGPRASVATPPSQDAGAYVRAPVSSRGLMGPAWPELHTGA